jgi:ketosteroid isomerase-like protein
MNRTIILLFAIPLVLFPLPACAGLGESDVEAARQEILAAMKVSAEAWNAGDIDRYMECYDRSKEVRFAGEESYSLGWQTVLDNYRKGYPDRASMGTLTYSDVDVTVISPDGALVFGRWRLDRREDSPSGLYTLLFRKGPAGWRIVHDHSTSADD